jgi:hypothetical protein
MPESLFYVVIILFICFSIRLDKASFGNFFVVFLGAFMSSQLQSHSIWSKIVVLALITLAVFMSPIPSLVSYYVRKKLLEPDLDSSTSALSNINPIKFLHQPENPELE